MADPPFNIDKIPGLNIDTDTIKTSASNLKTKAGNMRTAASTMKTTWSGMSACYKAPEQETLYAAMDPVDTGFDTLADNVERVGEYLETFATTVEGIKKDAQTLKTDAETFLASIKDDSEWTYDQNKVDTQNGLVSRAGALQVRLWDAERTCANNIRALDCLVAYHADPTSENDPLGYGYSEIPAGATGEWGGPVERDDHCPKRAAVSVKRAVWDDFVLGTVNGLTNFAGIEIGGPNGIVSASWETFTSTWQGVGGFFGLTWDEYGNFQGPRWSTVGNTIKETLKGLVHYDEWSTDPLRAVTATILDVASFAIPFAGAASKVGKFGKAGSVTARVGRVLEIVDKILQFTDPLGILTDIPMSKLTDTVVNALNITFDPTDLVAKWTGADAPAVDAPGVGGSTRGVDGASEVNVPEFDMEAGVPELDIPEVGAPELESLDVNVPEAAGTSSYDKTSSVEAENTVDLGVADRMSPTQPAEMAQPEMAMATSSQRVGELSSTGSVDGPGRVPEAHGSTGDAGIASADTAPTRAEAHASAGQTTPSSRAASGGSGAGETPSTHAAAGSGDTPARVTSGGDGTARATGSGDAAGHADHGGHGRGSADDPASGAGDSARPRPDAADGAGTDDRAPARPGADAPDGGHGRSRPEVDGADTARPHSDADAPGDGGGRHRRPETADGSPHADADARRPRTDADVSGDGGGRHRRPETADGSPHADADARRLRTDADVPGDGADGHHRSEADDGAGPADDANTRPRSDADVSGDGGGRHRRPETADGSTNGDDRPRSDADPADAPDGEAPDRHGDKADTPESAAGDPDGHHDPDAPDDHGKPDSDASSSDDGDHRDADGSDASDGSGDGSDADGGDSGKGNDWKSTSIKDWKNLKESERRTLSNDDPFNKDNRPAFTEWKGGPIAPGDKDNLFPDPGEAFGTGKKLEPNTHYYVKGRGDYYTNAEGEICHVETDSMVVTGRLNPDLQNPLPNATYTVDGKFHYTTDEHARTIRMEVDQLHQVDDAYRVRENETQRASGHIGKRAYPGSNTKWNGGHLAGTQFGGIPENINLVPMPEYVNQIRVKYPGRSYLEFEKQIASSGGYTHVVVTVEYPYTPAGANPLTSLQQTPTKLTIEGTDPHGVVNGRDFSNLPK